MPIVGNKFLLSPDETEKLLASADKVTQEDNKSETKPSTNTNVSAGLAASVKASMDAAANISSSDVNNADLRKEIDPNADILNKFNPYKLEENQEPLIKGIPFIFMTTPFLNLSEENIANDAFLTYMDKFEPDLLNTLSYSNNAQSGDLKQHGRSNSPFIKILTNKFKDVSLSSLSLRTKETNETFYGFKQSLPGSIVDSISAGEISVTYNETKGLSITKLHKVWAEYTDNIRRGIFKPSSNTLNGRFIDYLSSLYYFLLDYDMSTILFYSKYTGLFPLSVPYSNLGVSMGNHELVTTDISYGYSYKEDLNPTILMEFNSVAKNIDISGGTETTTNAMIMPEFGNKYSYKELSNNYQFSSVKVVLRNFSVLSSPSGHSGFGNTGTGSGNNYKYQLIFDNNSTSIIGDDYKLDENNNVIESKPVEEGSLGNVNYGEG